MTLISETPNQVLQLPVTTSGKINGRKMVRAIIAESIYCCMLLFLDHILYRSAHFVRDAVLAIIILIEPSALNAYLFPCIIIVECCTDIMDLFQSHVTDYHSHHPDPPPHTDTLTILERHFFL